jgi:glycosyltransferase involved in cell wall biosynthesis
MIFPLFSALVLPSYREGFGSVVLEAAACQIPSIVTNIPGPVDFVEENINGLIIQPGSVPDLIRALDYISSNLACAESMGRHAYRKSISNYTADFVVNSFIDDLVFRFLKDSDKHHA